MFGSTERWRHDLPHPSRCALYQAQLQASALDAWRDAELVVQMQWDTFLVADHASRSGAFAAYVAALDAEAAAAGELAHAHSDLADRREPWLVLAGPGHRLAGSGPVAAPELEGERLVVTGDRDGAGYDRFVADTLAALGVTAALERAGAGPAMLAAVAAGDALALTTMPYAAIGGVTARAIHPVRRVEFALLWRDETPAPALNELIRCAEGRAGAPRPMLAAVA